MIRRALIGTLYFAGMSIAFLSLLWGIYGCAVIVDWLVRKWN